MEAAEHVASALGDVDAVTVFDVVSRLVDKSLVARRGAARRRAALPTARDAARVRDRAGPRRR